MAMQRKTITITDQMENWVKSQVETEKYGNDREHFRDLVRRDQDRLNAEKLLSQLFDEAETSGISEQTAAETWVAVEARYAK